MNLPVAIAVSDESLFTFLHQLLVASGVEEVGIEPKALRDRNEVMGWLGTRDRTLLVLDARLPDIVGGVSDIRSTAVSRLLLDIQSDGIETPVVVITQGLNVAPELEAHCTPRNNAIALPSDKLRRYREAILKPFLSMVSIGPGGPATGNVPGHRGRVSRQVVQMLA
jgi:hypothetical protein